MGAGRKPKLLFVHRLLVTLVHLRHGLPHAVMAELYGVDRSTLSAAIRQVRPLLAARGFAVPDRPGLRLKTLEDVFAYAEAEGVDLCLDGAETQVRPPGVASWPTSVRLRQAQAEHHQHHYVQRRSGPHASVRGRASGPDARPD
ncbi:helix-turn-helix domain-containing protein, partial [Streptomyces sp. 24-1644]|uniref:helix-turn-helix domain-containing protein n=1 Tax=Streptomyces sp. 24-1644 TaxID=3457315 RepID=UPI003FA6AFA9